MQTMHIIQNVNWGDWIKNLFGWNYLHLNLYFEQDLIRIGYLNPP